MVRWLYRYIFRGFAIYFIAGMIIVLYLAIAGRK